MIVGIPLAGLGQKVLTNVALNPAARHVGYISLLRYHTAHSVLWLGIFNPIGLSCQG